MIYRKNTTAFEIKENTVISLGKFDGVHRGHEFLMETLLKKKKAGLKTVIFTFDIPPRKSVQQVAAKVLTTNEEKMRHLEKMGIDYLIECPFTKEVRCMEAEDFIRWIVEALHVKCFVVGDDFCFGHNRRGDYRMLLAFAKELDYEVVVHKKMQEDGRDISSTFVREEVEKGNLEKANHLLGYPYFVEGVVLHGRQIGRTIGIPTINLIPPEEKLLPKFGVYATLVTVGEHTYQGVTNVGCKPTIEGKNPVGVETHLLHFSADLYGKEVKVEFLKHIRPEIKFASVEELKQQMAEDIAWARHYFEAEYS